MRSSRCAITAAIVLATATMVQAPQVRAAEAGSAATAVGSCQASLPASAANLRMRPLAIRNEGSTNVFVSCGAQGGYDPILVDSAAVIATNLNTAAVDLTCTLIDGPLQVLAFYYPKTVSLEPNITVAMAWLPSDSGGTTFSGSENFSCILPPGVELNIVGFTYQSAPPTAP